MLTCRYDSAKVQSFLTQATAKNEGAAHTESTFLTKISNLFQRILHCFSQSDVSKAKNLFTGMFEAAEQYAASGDSDFKKSCEKTMLDNFYQLKEMVNESNKACFQIKFDPDTGRFALAINITADTSVPHIRGADDPDGSGEYDNMVADLTEAEDDYADADDVVHGDIAEADTTGRTNLLGSLAHTFESAAILTDISENNTFSKNLPEIQKILNTATPSAQHVLLQEMSKLNFFDNREANLTWGKLQDCYSADNAPTAMALMNDMCLTNSFETRLAACSELARLAKPEFQSQFKVAVRGISAREQSAERITLSIEMNGIVIKGLTFSPQEADQLMTKFNIKSEQIRNDANSIAGTTSEARKLMDRCYLRQLLSGVKHTEMNAMIDDLLAENHSVEDRIRMFSNYAKPEISHLFKLELSNHRDGDNCQFNFKIGDFTVATIPSTFTSEATVDQILATALRDLDHGFREPIQIDKNMQLFTDLDDSRKFKLRLSDSVTITLPDNAASQLKKITVARELEHIRSTVQRTVDPDKFNLDNSELRGLNFSGLRLAGISARNCDLTGSRFLSSTLDDANFSGSNLTNSNFQNANIDNTNFIDADRTGANFANTILDPNPPASDDDHVIDPRIPILLSDSVFLDQP